MRKTVSPGVYDFTGFTTEPIKEIMKEIVEVKKRWCGGWGEARHGSGEIKELISTTPEE